MVSRLERLIEDYRTRAWLGDFLAFAAKERLFATFLTPSSVAGEGEPDKRWDTARTAALNEILGFYGLDHWYAWQVTILDLGPVWQSDNAAALVSVFGRRTDVEGPDGYVFFAADSRHPALPPGQERRRLLEVQPVHRLDRHVRARDVRGRHPRPQPPPLRPFRHQLPARAARADRRVRQARRHEVVQRPRCRLLPLRRPRRPPLPGLQRYDEDEGDHGGREGAWY